MSNLIRWRRTGDGVGDVRMEYCDGDAWKLYKSHPLYQRDTMDGSSKGVRTMQILLKHGYKFDAID